MIELRPYQTIVVNKILADLQAEQNILLRAIMGAGKTVMTSAVIKHMYDTHVSMRFLVLAHKKELVEQFVKTLTLMAGIPKRDVGICCAGLNSKELNKRITVATVQTFFNCMKSYLGASLVIIDECHVIPYHDANSRYRQAIDLLRTRRPNCRIIGISATPFRLGHGFTYGTRCKPGEPNLFPRINAEVGYEELRNAGSLVPLVGKIASHESISEDLAGVSTSGDYVLDQLGEIMSREYHIHTAVEAIQQYCTEYKTICVFCCTIDHAQRVHDALRDAGEDATLVHSQLTDLERAGNMEAWKSGRVRIMVSVNILIEGFDLPRLDCLVMARPTLSAALYLQAVGRALRIHPGKKHGFLLDLTDNTHRFGTDLDNVKVNIPRAAEKIKKKEEELIKECPSCQSKINIHARICPMCGYEYPKEEITIASNVPDLKKVTFQQAPPEPPTWHPVLSTERTIHTSRQSGKKLGRYSIYYDPNPILDDITDNTTDDTTDDTADENLSATEGEKTETGTEINNNLPLTKNDYDGVPANVSLWFCLPDHYKGYAVDQSRKRWKQIGLGDLPNDVDEFASAPIMQPYQILIDHNGDYPEIKGWRIKGEDEVKL